MVTQAEALDGSRSFVRAHVCKVIEVQSGNRVWMYGTISDCDWDEKESTAVFLFGYIGKGPINPSEVFNGCMAHFRHVQFCVTPF
jgi:hypothetical protein